MMEIENIGLDRLLNGFIRDEDLVRHESEYFSRVDTPDSEYVVFRYIVALTMSDKTNILRAVQLLKDLLIISRVIPRPRIFLQMAIAHTRLKDYDIALSYLRLVKETPEIQRNTHVDQLEAIIQSRMRREGYMGALLVGGAVTVLGSIALAAYSVIKRR